MKKFLSLCMALTMMFCITGCGSEGHDGEAKTPSASSVQKGRNYQDVYSQFEEKGFTNIRFEALDDLVTGWLTKDGEVESVSVDGDTGYSADRWYPADAEVIITYHTFPDKESDNDSTATGSESSTSETPNTTGLIDSDILTVDNCESLANMFAINADRDSAYSEFASTYRGKTIEFDGSIDYKEKHSTYNSFNGSSSVSEYEYDILVSYDDYDANTQVGPTMKIENVSSRKLGYDVSKNLPDFMAVGSNVKIQVRVGNYDSDTGIFTMYLESITAR